MKKKLFLMCLMMAVLAIVFAISAFAEEIIFSKTESEEYGTVIQLSADPGLDNAKDYVSTLNKINNGSTDLESLCILTDGTYFYVFPSSYIVLENTDGKFEIYAGTESQPGLVQALVEFNTAMGTSYYTNYTMNKTYAARRLDALVRFEFPSDVKYANPDWCCMREYPGLKEIRILYPIDLSADKMFYSNGALTTVVGLENATVVGTRLFMYCRVLQSVNLPTNIVKIPDSMFFGCGTKAATVFTIPNILECKELTTIGEDVFRDSGKIDISIPDSVTTIEARAFQAGCKTGNITISEGSKLQTIGDNAFNSCTALKTLYIPSSVTSIGSYAFNGCSITSFENFENCKITVIKASTFEQVTALKSLKIPETVTTIENAFIGNKNLTKVYIPKSVTSIADTFVKSTWENPSSNAVYIYTGNNLSVFAECARFDNANVIKASEYDEAKSYTGINIVLGYSHCDAYYNGVHAENEITLDVKSFLETIQKYSTCVECGYGREAGKIPALFVCDGYSTPEDGRIELTVGFSINNEAIKEYEALSKKKVEFGAFAAAQTILGNGYIFDENGNVMENTVAAKIEGYGYGMFELKISGFKDTQKNVKLALGAYVITSDGETTEYSYLQAGTPNANENYSFISYNDVVGAQSGEDVTE